MAFDRELRHNIDLRLVWCLKTSLLGSQAASQPAVVRKQLSKGDLLFEVQALFHTIAPSVALLIVGKAANRRALRSGRHTRSGSDNAQSVLLYCFNNRQ